jgi:hypothetical protein
VKNCGTDFRWNMFGMTNKDADNLSAGLRSCRKLKKIYVRNSLIDDDILYAIYNGLKNCSKLSEHIFCISIRKISSDLFFSGTIVVPNNCLTDETVPILIKFLSCHPLKHIDLTNNQLTCEGAVMLAKFLVTIGTKSKLKRLNLSLNNIGKAGCDALCKVLAKKLLAIDLSVYHKFPLF